MQDWHLILMFVVWGILYTIHLYRRDKPYRPKRHKRKNKLI